MEQGSKPEPLEFKGKYRNAEYKATDIWYSRHDFSTCVTLKVHTVHCSVQGQGEQHSQLGVQMAVYT